MTDTKSDAVSTEEEREQAKDAQNLEGDNAVPETRPQAMTVADPSTSGDSELTKRLKEAEVPEAGVDEPMPQEAYDRAASEAQMRKAARSSQSEGLMAGNVAISTKGPHEGRVFAVTRVVEEGSVADMVRRLAGRPEQVLNQPKSVEVRAIGDERDGELLVLDVEENGLEKQNEAWRGTRAGRRH